MKMNREWARLTGGLTAAMLALALACGPGAAFADESGESETLAAEDTASEAAPAESESLAVEESEPADATEFTEETMPAEEAESDPATATEETELVEEAEPVDEAAPAEDAAHDEEAESDRATAADENGSVAEAEEVGAESLAPPEAPVTDEMTEIDPAVAESGDPEPVEGMESGNGSDEVRTRDPLEGMNRVFFKFNDTLDRLFLKPIAKIYRTIIPTFVQDRVRNVINNSNAPVILANDILQWKWGRAGDTTARFFINTTIGLGGIFEVAEGWGIKRHDEDFGQTLGVWGVGEWLYLYLPFVGPTNPRDLVGKVADRYFDPLTYYADVIRNVDFSDSRPIKFNIDTAGIAQLARGGAGLLDLRARNIDTLNEIERTSIDFYAGVRSLYRQSRDSAIKDGKVDFQDLPDLSDDFE